MPHLYYGLFSNSVIVVYNISCTSKWQFLEMTLDTILLDIKHLSDTSSQIFCVPVLCSSGPGVVPAPVLEAVSSSEILVSWQEPGSPNGVIISYRVFQNSGLLTSATQPGSFMSASLQSFTEYFFYVEVCTSAGCSVSTNTSIFTLEAGESTQVQL